MKKWKVFLSALLAAVMMLGTVLAEESGITVTVTPSETAAGQSDILVEADGDVEQVNFRDPVDMENGKQAIKLYDSNLVTDSEGNPIPPVKDIASVTVNVDGDVLAKEDAIEIIGRGSEISVTVGDVQTEGQYGNGEAIGLTLYKGSQVSVDAGQVTTGTKETDSAYSPRVAGVKVAAMENSSATVSTGDISASVNMGGDVDWVISNNFGISVSTDSNCSVRIDAGDVEVTSDIVHRLTQNAVEVNTTNESDVTITTGSLTTESSLESADWGITDAVRVVAGDNSTVVIAAEGDITAKDSCSEGVDIYTGDNAKAEIYADGTISGGNAGIRTYPESIYKTTITAWGIEGRETGTLILSNQGEDITDAAKDHINYIVKLGKGFTNSDVSTANGNTVTYDRTADTVVTHGKETDGEDYTYHTAVEDEQVSLTLNFGDGYDPDEGDTLNVLYNADDSKSVLKQGSQAGSGLFAIAGNVITLLMLRGGGMKLGASVNHAHKYVAVVTEPTCVKGGYTTHTCSRCGDSYTDSETKAKGHTPGTAVKENVVEPQIGVAGSYDEVVYCTDCGEELTRKSVTVDPLPEPEPEPEPKPEPKPEPDPEPKPAKTANVLLTVRDEAGKISLSFFSNGTFTAQMEDGSREKGTFGLADGALALICGGNQITVGEDGTFTYPSQTNPELTYQFRLDRAAMDTLKSAAK